MTEGVRLVLLVFIIVSGMFLARSLGRSEVLIKSSSWQDRAFVAGGVALLLLDVGIIAWLATMQTT
jgi:hypothetical protein